MNGALSIFVRSEDVFTGLRGAGAKFDSGPVAWLGLRAELVNSAAVD